MATKQDYPCPEVGARVQIGTLVDMINNIGAYDSLYRSSYHKKRLVDMEIPASFTEEMAFLMGAQGTVKGILSYEGPLINKTLQLKYNKSSFKKVRIHFDDPEIHEKARAYAITTPMLTHRKKLYGNTSDLKFIQKLGAFSKWGESYNSMEDILKCQIKTRKNRKNFILFGAKEI